MIISIASGGYKTLPYDRIGNDVRTDRIGNDVRTDRIGNDARTDRIGNDARTDRIGNDVGAGFTPARDNNWICS